MMKTLGQLIRELREKKDLSLREFAKRLGGLSAAFLSDVELGRRHPSEKVLAEMARVLETPLEELQRCDSRPPIEGLKRLSASNPAYGFAFRKLIDKRVTPEELLKFLEQRNKQPNKR